MMACRHAGLNKPTIIDDEGDAALDVEYAPRYVSMLRRAAELMDASKVLFVTHRPDSWNLADSRLLIDGGKVMVV
jgi:ABC-type molybdenum transport system ATPase subunit/photorepair protein PhrA